MNESQACFLCKFIYLQWLRYVRLLGGLIKLYNLRKIGVFEEGLGKCSVQNDVVSTKLDCATITTRYLQSVSTQLFLSSPCSQSRRMEDSCDRRLVSKRLVSTNPTKLCRPDVKHLKQRIIDQTINITVPIVSRTHLDFSLRAWALINFPS